MIEAGNICVSGVLWSEHPESSQKIAVS
jgi:hypothetical protein